ncbi:hypothetical protein [Kineosporia sp. R_H_3]|uniref:hypothetical protein n=1 Tax=Kineosporia sp. R_H_3 TaxID=1961848 RepID=UPI000B4BE255|nr:hypothetical protein [Kineosporia sp. R_H_3]
MVNAEGPLGLEDQLDLEIGRVARAHVNVDFALRQVYQALVMPSAAIVLVADIASTSRLIDDCRLMLKTMFPDGELREAALSILDAAKTANVERNRVVHDMWLRHSVDPEKWMAFTKVKGSVGMRAKGDPKDLEYIRAVRDRLRRVHLRMTILIFALQDELPFFRGGRLEMGEKERLEQMAVLQDRFEMTAGGAVVSQSEK